MNLFKGIADSVLSWFTPQHKKKIRRNPRHGTYHLLWDSQKQGTYVRAKHGELTKVIKIL